MAHGKNYKQVGPPLQPCVYIIIIVYILLYYTSFFLLHLFFCVYITPLFRY